MSSVDFTKFVKILRSGDKMTVARKNMNTNSEIIITEEDRKAAMASFMSTPVVELDDAITEYRNTLNEYCEKFEISTYKELVKRADELEFGSKISSEILEKYSFIERHQI